MNLRLTTYRDLIEHLTDYLGAQPSQEAARDARRAVQAGYRDLASRHRWSYFYTRGRLSTNAPFSDGSVRYEQASRTVTLSPSSSAGFPSWSPQGNIVLSAGSALPGNVAFKVSSNPTPLTLVLTQASNPGADVPAGATYTLYQDTYPLPVDCLAIDRLILINNAFCMWYEHPSAWLERQRIYRGPAIPRSYCIRGEPDYFGALALSFYPCPDNAYAFDFIYQRRPRPLVRDSVFAGTVSFTSGLPAVLGAGTSWDSSLVGSVLRLGPDNSNLPTGLAGAFPASYERIITAVSSPTQLTVDASFDQSLGPLKYMISDPVDIEETAMLTALFRSIEFQVSMSRNKKDREQALADYHRALIEAMEADSRNFAMESSGGQRQFPYRLANMPRGPDVS